jgi:16S rRNA processing protein RimM
VSGITVGDHGGSEGAVAGVGTALEVGGVVRPHGLKGDVIVSLSTNRAERLAPGSLLTTANGRTLRVVRASAHKRRYIVAFEGVDRADHAEELRGTTLFAPPLEDSTELWVHDLVGSRVEDRRGRLLGVVEAVQANPASDLLVLESGGLIPLRFVVDSDPGVSVIVDVPDGLLDLA